MLNQNLARGVFLLAASLFFGLGALRYPIGDLSRAGPGLFPLMVGSLLFIIAVLTLVQSRIVEAVPLYFNAKNIALIMASLTAFVLLSQFVSMLAGIVALVFIASFAGTSHSWMRSLTVSVALIAIAFGFQKLLGLNLKLF